MRFRIVMTPERDGNSLNPILPYNYAYAIGSMFYQLLIDHNNEYKALHDSSGFKFFTFSRLEIPRRKPLRTGLMILSNDVYLWFSSVNRGVAKSFAECILANSRLEICNLTFRVVGISVPQEINLEDNRVTFSTMSPIILRTVNTVNGSAKTWDLSPDDERFGMYLSRNLRRKYSQYYGKDITEDVKVVDISRVHSKRITLDGIYHRAHLMNITLEGPPELLEFAYDCGLGEKNSMGFGMVRIGGSM